MYKKAWMFKSRNRVLLLTNHISHTYYYRQRNRHSWKVLRRPARQARCVHGVPTRVGRSRVSILKPTTLDHRYQGLENATWNKVFSKCGWWKLSLVLPLGAQVSQSRSSNLGLSESGDSSDVHTSLVCYPNMSSISVWRSWAYDWPWGNVEFCDHRFGDPPG